MKARNRKRPRSRIQRAFLQWLAESQHRFAIPIRIGRRTDRYVDMELVGVNSILRAFMTEEEINVSVTWQGKCWDFIFWGDVVDPERVSNGYICKLCDPEVCNTVFSSRENLWRDHLFEPFLEWVNEKLATAEFIGIYEWEGGGEAKLLYGAPGEQDNRVALVSVRHT